MFMAIHIESTSKRSVYLRLFRNRTLLLLWGGQTISSIGDAFFNLAVMWVVYSQTGSVLQTAIVGVIWHMSDIIFGPIAGTYADRWDRKRIMLFTNVLAAMVVGTVAAIMFGLGYLPPVVAFLSIFLLNSLTVFHAPARASVMPEIVGRDELITASGLFSTVRQAAFLFGNAMAGITIAMMGAVWAVVINSVTFLIVALCIALAQLPARKIIDTFPHGQRPSMFREIFDGWRAITDQPVIRAMVWFSLLINVSSFLGPLYPALVNQRLHAGAAAYGAIEAAGIVGGMVGGVLVGLLERHLGAGRLLILGWGLAGICVLGMAASTWITLTVTLEIGLVFGLTLGSVSMGTLTVALIPENYRGRVYGITSGLSVVLIPFSTLAAGLLADTLGVATLFAIGGIWIIGVAGLAWFNPHVRTASITQPVNSHEANGTKLLSSDQ
jgi:DHA3 family macrolide efflux protein-like MFS transporter